MAGAAPRRRTVVRDPRPPLARAGADSLATRVVLTTIACGFLGLFVALPIVSVFTEAFRAASTRTSTRSGSPTASRP